MDKFIMVANDLLNDSDNTVKFNDLDLAIKFAATLKEEYKTVHNLDFIVSIDKDVKDVALCVYSDTSEICIHDFYEKSDNIILELGN